MNDMNKDIAVFLDLDNLVIGAGEADLAFDINLVLAHLSTFVNGRIALRRAYGDWRQKAALTKELAAAGFELQSAVRLSSNSKNLADMQMVVEAMSTLIDRQNFETYVLITGDRDFAPLVQALRRRGKTVIGVGVRHSTSNALANICDHFIYYDALADSSRQMLEEQLEGLLERALDQLLHENDRVAASLLKQRMQSLSKGVFGRSPQGKRNFRKLLNDYPQLVELQQVGTTLFVVRPGSSMTEAAPVGEVRRKLTDDEARSLLQTALTDHDAQEDKVRASLLKQRMQELSEGAFDEVLQGDKSYRRFLDRYPDLVVVELEGSTLYARTATQEEIDGRVRFSEELTIDEAELLLSQALDALLVDQPRVRASLLKQEMVDMSSGAFDESVFGYDTFRQFLARFPDTVKVQLKGTTLSVYKPDRETVDEELHIRYRSLLKKHGLRVVPADMRLAITKELVYYLSRQPIENWRNIVNKIYNHYQDSGRSDVSKSFINDVLRVSRRAQVVQVGNEGTLSAAPVKLAISGDRLFQEAVMRCDATFLQQMMSFQEPFNWQEASLALYDTSDREAYLMVIHERYPGVKPGSGLPADQTQKSASWLR